METATGSPGLDVLSMKDLLNKVEFDLPRVGQTLEGEIISVSKNAVLIDLGGLGTGIVYPGEFYDNAVLQKSLKPGQRMSMILLDIEGDDGYRELSLKRAQMTTAWQDIRNKKEAGETITTKVTNMNKGGLIVEINGIQGFLPLSQLAPEHYPKVQDGDTAKIVQALQKLRNTDIQVKIIDFFEDEGRLIVSERAINDQQLLAEVAKLKVGDVVSGTVTDVTDFGAFVKLDRPSPDIAATPELLARPGGKVTAGPSPEGLAQREGQFRHWDGTIKEVANPAFAADIASRSLGASGEKVKPESGDTPKATGSTRGQFRHWDVEGLIHISEIDWKLIDDPRDFLTPGQTVEAKIIVIEGVKISLSLKALKPDPWEKIEGKYAVGQTLDGEIVKITNYGVFVQIDEEITGLIPVSEFSGKRPSEVMAVGDNRRVAIVSIDPKEHKMLLTLQGPDDQESKT